MPILRKHAIERGLAILALAVCAAPARAATPGASVIATNLGPGGSYGGGAYNIQGNPIPGMNVAQSWAVAFIPSASAYLSDVILPLDDIEGPPSIIVGIASDNSGLPGSVLATLSQTGTIPSGSALVDFTCNGCVYLQAGTTYWVVTGVSSQSTFVLWSWSSSSNGNLASNASGSVNGPWWSGANYNTAAFEVDGFLNGIPAVPAPSTLSLVLCGLGIVLLALTLKQGARCRRSRSSPLS
jgi:hypothetical protein